MKFRKSIQRLASLGWMPGTATSTQYLYYKHNWRCAINRETGEMKFKKINLPNFRKRVNLMRGKIEEGIE